MPDPLNAVIDTIATVLRRKHGEVPPLSANTPLDGALGLDSLDFAEVVVRLEHQSGVDPFAAGAVEQLRTIGDLANLYRR